MKIVHGIALIALAFSTQAWSQAANPAAKAEPKKEAASKVAEAKPAAAPRKSRASEDCRFCLEKGSNTEIIKCAEQYL